MERAGGVISQVENEKWTLLKTLRHARHDWMNDIQIVKGYLSLNNIDAAARAADHIILKAVQESRLCNLGMPGMAELFMTFNWSQHLFRLEYELDESIAAGTADDQKACRFFNRLFSLLEQHVKEFNEHELFVHLSEKQGSLAAEMEWMGEVANRPLLLKKIKEFAHSLELKSAVWETDSGDILMEVTF
ncbi:Spo0B C-terminal domain-containing protein [Domibacillus sp. DTU_2020_1001157_1_SI_ALB_TIR_016]|uniref:Spo0B C-terminal domain-containing protein n=1 Tax=Domibacillus sp. DTU_2020_1001157_1_SI_ALB_TIR_016 TaxID=3077789 RepID=UPI0028EB47F2|nr:Spo0B C-terminal domain-containing protein [Domibacillus sp. DTU_2020_1001157_1_SI_ALB_TIR_016]WNS81833.1 Spo0B C-terminal domain-containing protein [Domibacillus sp. DTU_2020_1001157_1_SI_ALB_TIR_016]